MNNTRDEWPSGGVAHANGSLGQSQSRTASHAGDGTQPSMISSLEKIIDAFTQQGVDLDDVADLVKQMHTARTISRNAEREVVAVTERSSDESGEQEEDLDPLPTIEKTDKAQEKLKKREAHELKLRNAEVLHSAELWDIETKIMSKTIRKDHAFKVMGFGEGPSSLSSQFGRIQHTGPIFEIRKLYWFRPRRKKRKGRRSKTYDSYSGSDVNSRSTFNSDDFESEDAPNENYEKARVEREAGAILVIQSQFIIEVVKAFAGHYPGFSFEEDNMVVPEPFCVLLYLRGNLLAYAHRHRESNRGADAKEEGHAGPIAPEPLSIPDTVPKSATAASHIERLFSFLDDQYLHDMEREKARWACNPPVCTFDWVWMLFAPGMLVYETSTLGSVLMRAYEVKTFSIEGLFDYGRDKDPRPLRKRLWSIEKKSSLGSITSILITVAFREHDGRYWRMKKKAFQLRRFDGEKPISKLTLCPVEYFDDPDGKIRSEFIRRGRLYHSLSKRRQANYSGENLSGIRQRIDSRIMVDSETRNYDSKLAGANSDFSYSSGSNATSSSEASTDDGWRSRDRHAIRNESSRNKFLPPKSTSGRKQLLSTVGELSEEQYMICTAQIPAYVLKDRSWFTLAVQSVSECKYQEALINELQITTEARRLIQALSDNYTYAPKEDAKDPEDSSEPKRVWTSDFISSKGGGQIILLHGKPGVGKTSTAECIAELTRRPLLTITCGDLGSQPSQIQSELTRWLRLSRLWNAVVLFDEADIFLDARERGDVVRNSIVSIFLRELEYYQGLMFLTTNRIGTFDEAILSRIHVVLHLPNLTNDDREKIWETSFTKIIDERSDVRVSPTLTQYALADKFIQSLNWNGREIRNAFNTMVALAQWDAKQKNSYTRDGKIEVKYHHLKEVARMSDVFKKYLFSIRNTSEDEYAIQTGIRGLEKNDKPVA